MLLCDGVPVLVKLGVPVPVTEAEGVPDTDDVAVCDAVALFVGVTVGTAVRLGVGVTACEGSLVGVGSADGAHDTASGAGVDALSGGSRSAFAPARVPVVFAVGTQGARPHQHL